MGATGKVPVKPDFLEKYEIIRDLRMPFVSGGYVDQPALWLLEYRTIDQEVKLMEAINDNADRQENVT